MESLDIFKNKHLIFVKSLKEPFNRKSLKFLSAMPGCRAVNGIRNSISTHWSKKKQNKKTKTNTKTKTKTKQKNKKQTNKQTKKQTNKNWLHSMSIFPSTSMHSLFKAKSLLTFFHVLQRKMGRSHTNPTVWVASITYDLK